jgi:hypothetical protein
MNPNARQLAMRDPALAALMGALPGQDFGHDAMGGQEADFGISPFDVSANIGEDDFGAFGYGFGADAALAAPAATPHPAVVQAAYHAHVKQKAHTTHRTSLLDPNAHSTVKVERYSFSISTPLVLNVASAINMTLQPNTKIRPQRVIFNAPSPNFVIITTLQVANVNVFVGGSEDANTYGPLSQGVMLDLPTLEPANRATVTGNYTGFVPPGFANNFAYTFIATFQGPSTIAGGG